MPAVLVHGNPETSEVWDSLRSELRRSGNVAVSMPGFGCSRPDDFGSSKEEYLDRLMGELEQLGEPVDLVGHDWGGFARATHVLASTHRPHGGRGARAKNLLRPP
jgi:pimeloyl-ACP methyl ester carboxylesterase